MTLEILSPEAVLFNGLVEYVTLPGTSGVFQILPGHASIISALKKGHVRFKIAESPSHMDAGVLEDGQNDCFSLLIQGGVIEMDDNKVVLLAE
ncbi:MAG: F0F1 ATP synthase subunit epsilon [Flavobacteriales bacterium]